ncbi:MAG TPA: class I SAM-dependent methyltransferase [Phycisphaerales bacterium]|nr:class I SAM-dependent methyltransferase [Phycisphaerales bacterium]
MIDAARLNGDTPLTPEQSAAYLAYHAARNRRAHRESLTIKTFRGPAPHVDCTRGSSPSRVATCHFFQHVATIARNHFADNPVTILDVGCGRGNALEPFANAGLRGEYIGIDIARHPAWSDAPLAGFTRRLILGDIHSIDPRTLGAADIVTSCTALEHFRDDNAAVQLLVSLTKPRGLQAHAVPGEFALKLYGLHGWRQYAPIDLATLFPTANFYRYGGPLSNRWHYTAITARLVRGKKMLQESHPYLYSILRDAAMLADRLMGDTRPSLYGVLWFPHGESASSTLRSAA